MAMELLIPGRFGVSFLRNPSSWSRNRSRRRFPAVVTAELQSTVGVSDHPAVEASASVPNVHHVTVHDRQRGIVHQFLVPEDQYILHMAESQNISLPFACRHGCCTSCAVRIKSGQIKQPEALGISTELKSKGYALLCVGFAASDIEVETQDEDEVYWLQFGRYFAGGPIVILSNLFIKALKSIFMVALPNIQNIRFPLYIVLR
ncbi:Ferredoxin [Apostasia shenzhenica]|uniref:Ferredoxin n=1 Tax=Apostasia shenzhenica TaxID=1088818 RepID=A0A2I0BD27_9ASPA|nr:Ferredoxin [Apostasia shenzhenica]